MTPPDDDEWLEALPQLPRREPDDTLRASVRRQAHELLRAPRRHATMDRAERLRGARRFAPVILAPVLLAGTAALYLVWAFTFCFYR